MTDAKLTSAALPTLDAAVRAISCFGSYADLARECREHSYTPTVHLDAHADAVKVAEALAAEGFNVFTLGEPPKPAITVLDRPRGAGEQDRAGGVKLARHVVATFTDRKGAEGQIVREVTRTTGYHAFVAVSPNMKPRRIGSTSTLMFLAANVPAYLAEQVEGALGSRSIIDLRMPEREVAAMKRAARKARQPQVGRTRSRFGRF